MTNAVEDKQRIEKWDIAKGILIFLVVLSHMVQYHTDASVRMRALYLFIFTFHMPCFLFIDGMFSKKNINEKRYTHIFSYLIMYVFIRILISLTKFFITHKFSFNLFSTVGVAWYGLVLFLCSMATIFLKRFPKKWVLCASIILACFIGYDKNISGFLSLARFFNFYPFFFLGYCVDPEKIADWFSSQRAKIAGCITLIVFGLVCFFATDALYFTCPLILGCYPYSEMSAYGMGNIALYGGLLRLVYYAVVLTVGISFLCIIPKHVPKFLSGITTVGRRSLQIYVLHRPVLYILYDGMHMSEWIAIVGLNYLIIIPIAILITIFLAFPVWEKPIHAIIYPQCLDNKSEASPDGQTKKADKI